MPTPAGSQPHGTTSGATGASAQNKSTPSEKALGEDQCVSNYNLISGVDKCGFDSPKCLETIYIYCYPGKKLKAKKTRWVDNPWYGQSP